MALLNTFDPATTQLTLARIEKLSPDTKPGWGKMNASQVLAHLNVSYDMAYGKIIPKQNFIIKLMLKLIVKKIVTSEKPYPKNTSTAPEFLITDTRDFEKEKNILITYIKETESKGITYFEGKESVSFGKLTASQWSNQFYKHLDHHLTQFGV